MPCLDSNMHLMMLNDAKEKNQMENDEIYGLHWGDPNSEPHLKFIRDNYIYRYLNPEHFALEIGPGGGRWTRYLLSFGKIYAVDYHDDLLLELTKNYRLPHLISIKNNGTDFPGIENSSVDYIFSFGVFVHLELDVIKDYLSNIYDILKVGGNVIIHYSDKRKKLASQNKLISNNTPDKMREEVLKSGFIILEENLTILPHGVIMRFTK